MPASLSVRELQELIADSIACYVKAYDVAQYCVALGLPDQAEGEEPFRSKRVYVRSKLIGLSADKLRQLARRVADELGDDALIERLGQGGPQGVDGELKNIIFASVGYKPRIVMTDAINNIIDVVKYKDSCLIYDQPLTRPALVWGDLIQWWSEKTNKENKVEAGRDLYRRLSQSLDSPPEKVLFQTYCKRYGIEGGVDIPALLPQVYLHYDPYTRLERLNEVGEIKRERMDFLLLMPNRARVVLEVDGKQHYAESDGSASTARYAEMMAEDRKIRLKGYEVYRFGGSELMKADAPAMLDSFFDRLLTIHG